MSDEAMKQPAAWTSPRELQRSQTPGIYGRLSHDKHGDFTAPLYSEACIEELRRERNNMLDYTIDLQRCIEAFCGDREIPEPTSAARHHYNMAVAFREARLNAQSAPAERIAEILLGTINAPEQEIYRVSREIASLLAPADDGEDNMREEMEREQREAERRELENREMEEHFARHPHG